MLAELSQGRSCGRVARGGRASVCRVEFSYPVPPAALTLSSLSDRPKRRYAAGHLNAGGAHKNAISPSPVT